MYLPLRRKKEETTSEASIQREEASTFASRREKNPPSHYRGRKGNGLSSRQREKKTPIPSSTPKRGALLPACQKKKERGSGTFYGKQKRKKAEYG